MNSFSEKNKAQVLYNGWDRQGGSYIDNDGNPYFLYHYRPGDSDCNCTVKLNFDFENAPNGYDTSVFDSWVNGSFRAQFFQLIILVAVMHSL